MSEPTKTKKTARSKRPNRIDYYLGAAIAIAARAECQGLHVGCVIVGTGNRVLSTGYNGAPEGFGNCSDGGVCPRCDKREAWGSGEGYDKCICVHAEMNAISAAARFGMPLDGATAYVTHQPCFTCAKELIQAGITRAYYAIARPVGDRNPLETSEQDRVKDIELKRTEARLLGELRAVQIKSSSCALDGINNAITQFKTERKESEDAAKDALSKIEKHLAKDEVANNGSRSNGVPTKRSGAAKT